LPLDGNPRVEVIAGDLDGVLGEDLLFATGKTLHAAGVRRGMLRELWTLQLPAEPQGEVVLADDDGDSRAEILFVGKDGALYCFK